MDFFAADHAKKAMMQAPTTGASPRPEGAPPEGSNPIPERSEANRIVDSLLAANYAKSKQSEPIDDEITRLRADLTTLREALEAFLAFGRPREGSDRYHQAWDNLKAAAAGGKGEG